MNRFLTLLVLIFIESCYSYPPVFSVRGTLTCYGIPYRAIITLINHDNLLGHIFTIREVGYDGKFHLNGEPVDDLDVRLIIEHTCADWKNGKPLIAGPPVVTKIGVNMEALSRSGYNIDVGNIELSHFSVRFNPPNFHILKAILLGKRIIFDTKHRLQKG
ncbi:unnamed protein product [Caenorhabditis nigoni]